MYTRLWWKDARQFWPIWAFLVLAAAVMQLLLVHYAGADARHGGLSLLALLYAGVYALATGSAAFAGERETGTLLLLDILPVDRRVVWVSKVFFALVTTLALALVLLAMAAVSTEEWKSQGSFSALAGIGGFGILVLEALGWGFLWSAILSNALTAAVIAICCTGVSMSILLHLLPRLENNAFLNHVYSGFVIRHLCVFLATLIASVVIFARSLRGKRLQLEFQSPIVVNWAESVHSRRVPLQSPSPVTTVLTPTPATSMFTRLATDEPPRRSWVIEARVLAWQTMTEGGTTWSLLAAIGLATFVLFSLSAVTRAGVYAPMDEWILLMSISIALVAGANVFGLENRGRTQQFLTHHGARPGLVWLVKLAVWGAGLALIWGTLAVMGLVMIWGVAQVIMPLRYISVGPIRNWLPGVSIVALFFAIALLCGMAIRRGITAVVIALVIGLALTIPLVAIVVAHMLPAPGLLAIPAGLLAVSWAWSGDWLLERPAPGRWVRLGLLVAGMFSLLVSWYAGYRAWSIRDVGPIGPPTVWIEAASTPLPADRNAADLYREAGFQLVGPFKDSPEFLDRNRELLDLLRRAAAKPFCRFLQAEKPTVLDRPELPPVTQLAYLLTLDANERRNQGDLTGTWNDIVALFKMAHQLGGEAWLTSDPAWVERNALGQALEWAVARGQTPERLHAALAAYRDLPKIPSAADMVRAEASLVENALDLPTSTLRAWASESVIRNSLPQLGFASPLLDLATMPWERVRARRLNRLVCNAAIQDALREPWQRSPMRDPEIEFAQKTSPNAMMLIDNPASYVVQADLNEVARRALVQVLALRAWQLKHGDEFPKTLDALVPEELPALPNDPYAGRPFRYSAPTDRRAVTSVRYALTPSIERVHDLTVGGRLLYSVGPDGRDDGGFLFPSKDRMLQLRGDFVFEIPPLNNEANAGKKDPSPRIPNED